MRKQALEKRMQRLQAKLKKLSDGHRTGKFLQEGVTAAIIGRPNVGKSTLLNLLTGEDKAIVTDIAGTTRDVLETQTQIGKAVVRLRDTAGVRECEGLDKVESIGIELTRRAIRTGS